MSDSDGQVEINIVTNVDEQSKKISNFESQVNNFDISGLQGSMDNLNQVIGGLSSQFADFTKPVQQDDSALKELQETIKTQYEQIQNLQKAYQGLETKFKKQTDEIPKQTTLYQDYKKAINDNIEVMRNLAMQGDKNSKGFQEVATQIREYQKVLKETDDAINKATGGMLNQSNMLDGVVSKLKGLVTAYVSIRGAQMAFNGVMQSVEAFRTQERAITALNVSLENSGVYSQSYSKHLQDLASEIQSYSNYGDEAILKAQSLGQSFAGAIPLTDNLTKSVVDFASATGMDLESAFTLVGKSIGTGTNALARYGVKLDKGMSSAQKMEAIIKQLSARFDGQAKNMADAGVQLQNALGDLSESIGKALNPTVESLQKTLLNATVGLKGFVDSLPDRTTLTSNTAAIAGATTVFLGLRPAITGVTVAFTGLRTAITGLNIASLINPIGLAAAAFGGLTYAVIKHYTEIENAKNTTQRYIAALNDETNSAVSQINEYRNLITAKNRTNAQNERLSELTSELTSKYPKYIEKLKQELSLKGKISKATAEQIANEMTLAEVKKLNEQKTKIDAQVSKSHSNFENTRQLMYGAYGGQYGMTYKPMQGRTGVKKALQIQQDEIKKQLEAAKKNRQKIINELTNTTIGTNYNYSDNVEGSAASASKTKQVQQLKDAFEKLQAQVQTSDKAVKAALAESGGVITPAVTAANNELQKHKSQLENVQNAYESLNTATKTPFEQLNFNLEQAKQNIINLASQPVVDLDAIKQAQIEYQGFLSQQEQINTYLQPAKGAYQELTDKVSELTQKLRDLAAENQVGSEEWNSTNAVLQQEKTRLDEVNKSLEQQGIKTKELSKSISSSISSGIISAVKDGGNAFETFSNMAVSALQKVLDKVLEMSVVTPILNGLTGGTAGTAGTGGGLLSGLFSIFGSKNGNVFQNGNIIPFAKGGIVNKPTIFPMANGGTGLMGEAGAEAVMPLRRMSNGRLGVEAGTSKGGQVVNIYNYSGANVETQKRDDNTMDIFIKKVNYALANERTQKGFQSAYSMANNKGIQAV